MKKLLLFLMTAALSTTAFSATYEVPVATELKQFATFQLKDFEVVQQGKIVIIKYQLPLMLTGQTEYIKLQGVAREDSPRLYLTGDKGSAKCLGIYSVVNCVVRYKNLNIDEGKATEIIRSASKSEEEFAARVEVMNAFTNNPEGIITY